MFLKELATIIEQSNQLPVNTHFEPLIDIENIKVLKDFNHAAGKIFNGLDFINKYILHPYNIWISLYIYSYPIVIIIGSIGIILWAMGWKKGIKITSWSAAAFAIIRIIGI